MQIEPKIAGDETEPKRAGDEFLTIPGLLATLNKREKVATREFLYRAVQRGGTFLRTRLENGKFLSDCRGSRRLEAEMSEG